MSAIWHGFLGGVVLVSAFAFASCSGDGGSKTTGGSDGTGGTGGTPGTLEQTVAGLCQRLDECNELQGISAAECVELTKVCVDETFLLSSLKEDWAMIAGNCLGFANCAVFVGCYEALDCSIPSGTGGTGGTGGAGGTGGSGGEGGVGGIGGAGCDTNVPGDLSSQVCIDCFDCAVAGPCLAQSNQCQAECLDYIQCFNNCADAACVLTCNEQYPDGREQTLALWTCVYCEQCPTNCSFDELCNPG